MGSLNCGMGIGWLSPALPQMQALFSPEPELASWLASAFPLSALLCTPLVALLAEAKGRKVCAMAAGVPFVINSIIIIVSSDIFLLLAGRFIMGIGVALAMGNIPTYIGETSETRMRGILGSFLCVTYTVGITASYVVGGFISYRAAGVVMLVSGLLSVFLFFLVPETPAWLVKKGKFEEATDSISWLWQMDKQSSSVLKELERLQEEVKIENPSRLEAAKKLWSLKPLRRGFLICLMTFWIQGWMGMITVHSHSISIFMNSGLAKLSPEEASVIYGCIQIIGALSVTYLVEHMGRKRLLIGSSLGVSVCMISMGTYLYLHSEGVHLSMFQWLPVLALSLCVYTYTVGAGSVPFILISDLLTNEVRSLAGMVIMQLLFTDTFLLLRFYNPVVVSFGSHTVFFFFGISAAVGGTLFLLLLPETKGRSTEEIQEILNR